MPLIPLNLPPGVVKPGTVYDARGRWYVADFVRWKDGVMQPMGGWEVLAGATGSDVTGPVRGMLAWKLNDGSAKLFIGTNSKAYVYDDGTLTDVTPASGFTTGDADASGNFWARTEANSWQIDTFGEDLVAVAWADGDLLEWDSSAGGNMATVTNAPTSNLGVVVTPERFLVALGAGGDGRKVQWADQETKTTWTPASTNQAGDFILSGQGQIQAGHRGREETLIWTDVDLFSMRYVAGDFVYSFRKVGGNCGAISRRSMAVVDGWAMWMGHNSFYIYDGGVRSVPSDVSDFVFNDLNRAQASKIECVPFTDFNEMWWFYPSSSSTENDTAVGVNYEEGHWMVTEGFERTAGVDRGFLEFPILADASGAVYFHENGHSYIDDGGSPIYAPNAESGPFEIGNGDRVMTVRQIVPAEETLGDVAFSLFTGFTPMDTETEHGPFTSGEKVDVDDRASGRQVRLKIEHPENKLTDPEALEQTGSWARTNLSAVTADQSTGPDGLSSLDELVEDGTNGSHKIQQTITGLTANATLAFTVYGTGNTRDWMYLTIIGSSGGIVEAYFDISNGAVGQSAGSAGGTLSSATIEEHTDIAASLYRGEIVGSVGNGDTQVDVEIRIASADGTKSYTGDGASSIYAGFAMLQDDVSAAANYPLMWRFGTPRLDVKAGGRR